MRLVVVVVGVAVALVAGFLALAPAPLPPFDVRIEEGPYELRDIQAPRLAGNALRFFALIGRLPRLGEFVIDVLKTTNNFHVVRHAAAALDDVPLTVPLHLVTAEMLRQGQDSSAGNEQMKAILSEPARSGAPATIADYHHAYTVCAHTCDESEWVLHVGRS